MVYFDECPRVHVCCLCIPLKVGIALYGFIVMTFSICSAIVISIGINIDDGLDKNGMKCFALITSVLDLIFAVILVCGILVENPHLILVYLLWILINLVMLCSLLLRLTIHCFCILMIGIGIHIAFSVYMFIVINTYRLELLTRKH